MQSEPRAITLTVVVITYNHAPFIQAAIESVLMQVTDFDYEIIISEDCSTDGTRQIVEHFARTEPNRIRLLLSERNLNNNAVVRRGLEAARGRYIALLDGDDYWTSTAKLQMQVDFLDRHSECSTCFHNVEVVYDDGSMPRHVYHLDSPTPRLSAPMPKAISTLADIVCGNFIQTCSAVFRSGPTRRLPDWYDERYPGDWSLHVLNAEHGDLAFIDEVLAAYRVHPGGAWSSDTSLYRRLEDVEAVAQTYEVHNRHLGYRFDSRIRRCVADLYAQAAYSYRASGNREWARTCALRALMRSPFRTLVRRWRLIPVLVAGRRGSRRALST